MKTVALVSPASPCSSADVRKATSFLNNLGFHVRPMPHILDSDRFVAGLDENRAMDIIDAFTDSSIDIIMSMRGGYGTPRLLNKLDYSLIEKNKKPFFGFSDTTALQLALWNKAGLPSFSGFQGTFDVSDKPLLKKSLTDCLTGVTQQISGLTPLSSVVYPVQGKLIGGTLTLINTLLGTKYCPDFSDAILFIEEVQEQPYHIDRMLNQLFLNGVFDRVKAVLLGGFYNCFSKDASDGTTDDVLQERFAALSIPVLEHLPYTHGKDHVILPIGVTAHLIPQSGQLVCPAPF